jgi:hypothetical protein
MMGKRVKLTKTFVESIEPDPKKDILVWDSELIGFGVKVTPKGYRSYFCFYRTKEGMQRRPTISAHGVLTLDQARKKAQGWLTAADNSEDPLAESRAARESMTLRQFTNLYIHDHSIPYRKPGTIEADECLIRNHIVPALGSKILLSITQ